MNIAELWERVLLGLESATNAERNEDDKGMATADNESLVAWCEDLEARVGVDVTYMRAAMDAYIAARRDPSTTIKPVKPVGILPPIGPRAATFRAIMGAGKAAFPEISGLVYVTATRAYFQQTGNATPYSVAITPAEYTLLTVA